MRGLRCPEGTTQCAKTTCPPAGAERSSAFRFPMRYTAVIASVSQRCFVPGQLQFITSRIYCRVRLLCSRRASGEFAEDSGHRVSPCASHAYPIAKVRFPAAPPPAFMCPQFSATPWQPQARHLCQKSRILLRRNPKKPRHC